MITSDDLAGLKVRKLIFHDVPKNAKGSAGQPTLADTETPLDPRRSAMLKQRLVRALGAKSAYPMEFASGSHSPLPGTIRKLTEKTPTSELFVEASRTMATHLFDQQGGAVSAGLLCLVEVTSHSKLGVAVMKLEREEGAKLELVNQQGRKSFEMAVLDDLVLTDGTRLFKSALFIRDSKDEFRCVACDNQNGVTSSDDIAQFWMRFLGCKFAQEPRVSTQTWFDTTVRFVNDTVVDPVAKNELYEHLVSELNSNRRSVSPKRFAEEYVRKELRQPYTEFLKENGVLLTQFQKDTSDISSKLRRRAFYTEKGVTVTAPADEVDLVEVAADQIVVHDQLRSIARK